ncbi:conserved hypothetical protein [Theileria equi strain WA]|uniref:Intimal thickness related receptor IRP domain-containing protein n=1 Tax=Theileria equi strain WA TaxID=1537102 RepID=L1LBN6_THEEQ|nr:conserved hypothetical protein [Theileria equi strain WA]EKX72680.1 conserved hypothetical protein [Theileria equi strain WA]|eukprot:XP_004832132.1 conserved hypothetical protein [Theileria equi strain WA]
MRGQFSWLLSFAIALPIIESYTLDLSTLKNIHGEVITHLCEIPLLAVSSEELATPFYFFSLEKGGRIFGYAKITSAGKLDDGLIIPDDDGTNTQTSEDTAREKSRQRPKAFDFSWRTVKGRKYGNHHNWVHLLATIFGSDKEENVIEDDDQDSTVDNLYLILFSQAQWELYLSTSPLSKVQPSKNKRGFVYYSNMISSMRIPLTKVGDTVSFGFEAPEPNRYVLVLFNTDQRKLSFEGYIRFINPKSLHLPIELAYHFDVLKFWTLIFLSASIISLFYLFAIRSFRPKSINYLLALNFLFYSTFLFLDMLMVNSIRETGNYTKPIWALAHLLKRFHEIFILLILVLVALGWKIMRESLSVVESQLITSISAVSVLMGFVEVLISGFDVSRYLVHAIACICILVATNFNIVIINSRISDDGLSPYAGSAYSNMKKYNNFRIIFFTYILKPAIFSSIRFICLQPSINQMIIWDEHLNLFLGVCFDFVTYLFLFINFLPRTNKGLFGHLFQSQQPPAHQH